MRGWLLLVVVGGLWGCRSKSTEPAAATSSSARAASSAAKVAPPRSSGAASSATPLASAQEAPPPPPDPALEAARKAALARARKLQAESRFAEAKVEFLKAWGGPAVMNLQPLVELGYMELENGPGGLDEAMAFLRAGTASGDPDIAGPAWYNLSLAHARNGETEAERAALARSLARRDNQTVKAKLKGRSRCVIEVLQQNAVPEVVIEVVSGWQAVCEKVGRCDDTATTVAEARARTCVTADGANREETHGCEGAGPWDSSWDYSWFTFQASWVAPLGRDRFFVAQGRAGGWPAKCHGSPFPRWSQAGRYAVALGSESYLEPFPDLPLPFDNPEQGACLEFPGDEVTAVYAANTAKLLAAVRVPSDFGVTVGVDEDAKRLKVSGGDCDGYLPLDGSMRFAATPP